MVKQEMTLLLPTFIYIAPVVDFRLVINDKAFMKFTENTQLK